MHDFPAGRLAVWATAWLSGRTSYDHALDALVGDTAHRVSGLPGTDEAVALGPALSALRGLGERRFRLVLPVPGDVRGLPAVPGLAALALESGQAAVGERLALVPEPLGPEVIAWTAFPLDGAPPVAPPVEGTPAGGLRRARPRRRRRRPHARAARRRPLEPRGAGAAGRAGEDDDGARASPTTTTRSPSPCSAAPSGWPPSWTWRWPTRPGAAVNHAQAAARDTALRPLADAVREATTAAFNWIPREPSAR